MKFLPNIFSNPCEFINKYWCNRNAFTFYFKPFIFFFLFLINTVNGNTQSTLPPKTADSLWHIWKDITKHDTVRLQAIYDYSWDGYLFSQPDSADYFARIQYEYAKKKNLKKYMAYARNTQGASFLFRGNFYEAINYYNESLKLDIELGDKKGIANSLNNIGQVYKNQGNYQLAINNYVKSLEYYDELNDSMGKASALNNIGNIYTELNDYKKAQGYFEQSLLLHQEIKNDKGISTLLNNLGVIYSEQLNYDKAIEFYNRSIEIKEEMGDKIGVASTLINICNVYSDKNDFVNAVKYAKQSLKLYEEVGDKFGAAFSLITLGNVYLSDKDYSNAIRVGKEALKFAKTENADVEIKNAAWILYTAYKKTNRTSDALSMYELYIVTKDSIESRENRDEVIRQEFKYKYEKKATTDSIEHAKEIVINESLIAKQEAEITAADAELTNRKMWQYFLFGGLALVIVFAFVIYNRFRITQKQKSIIQLQKDLVDEKNKEILDSIKYAKRIQAAILPPEKLIKKYFPESFILYKPKDIVAGDFYFMEKSGDKIILAVADCTGHGVPGALVSVICHGALNRAVREFNLSNPALILDKTREIVIQEFEKSEEEVKDGMDISLVSIKYDVKSSKGEISWGGANNSLWYIKHDSGVVTEIRADKQPIGATVNPVAFKDHHLTLEKGDLFFLFTDGYADQFGGPKGKKFKYSSLQKLLIENADKELSTFNFQLLTAFEKWKGDLEQVDDVCIIGIKI